MISNAMPYPRDFRKLDLLVKVAFLTILRIPYIKIEQYEGSYESRPPSSDRWLHTENYNLNLAIENHYMAFGVSVLLLLVLSIVYIIITYIENRQNTEFNKLKDLLNLLLSFCTILMISLYLQMYNDLVENRSYVGWGIPVDSRIYSQYHLSWGFYFVILISLIQFYATVIHLKKKQEELVIESWPVN